MNKAKFEINLQKYRWQKRDVKILQQQKLFCTSFLNCQCHWTAVNNLELSGSIWVQLSSNLHATPQSDVSIETRFQLPTRKSYTATMFDFLLSMAWVQFYGNEIINEEWTSSYLIVFCWQHVALRRMQSKTALTNPAFWISESFGLVPGKFYHSLLHIKDRQIVDSLMNGNSRISQEYWLRIRISMSRNVELSCPQVTIDYWCQTETVNDCEHQKLAFPTLRLPTSLSEHVCSLQWKIRNGGLSHGRTAHRKLPCQGIVSGNSYLPTKGSKGTQYVSLKFWKVEMDSP